MKSKARLQNARQSLVLLLILTPFFVLFLGIILPKQPSSTMRNDCFWANKINNDYQYDILLIGDSRIYRGLDPATINQKLHLSTFNFGFSSAGLDSILLTNAIHLLKPDGKKIILIGITPASFTYESLKNEHFNSLKRINQKEIWMRKNIYPSLTFFDNYSLSDLKKISQHENYFQTFNINGFAYSNKVPADSFNALKPYIHFLKNNKINTQAILDFFKIINKFHDLGIKCYGIRVPVASPIEKLENTTFDFISFARDFEKANGYWIDLPKHGFISYDGSHLEGPSALRLSQIIADSLQRLKSFE